MKVNNMTDSIFRRKQSIFFRRRFFSITRAIRFIPSVLMVIGIFCVTNLAQAEVTYYLNEGEQLTTIPFSKPYTQIVQNLYAYEATAEWRIGLTDNLEGDTYRFSIWAYALKSSFRVEIILFKSQEDREIVLATWGSQTTTESGLYQLVEGETTGIEPNATSGDQLILRITKTSSGYNDDEVSIMTADGYESSITIKSKDGGDGGGGCFITNLLK
jgi:hypothetical protein